jgi:hypothetical protein
VTIPDLFSSGLHPGSSLPPYVQASERKVHEALATAIPASWSAWHSLKIRVKSGDFSEADFVVADTARGILVLEVKGGIVRKQDGVWFQNERPMKMPPFDQAHRFVRILLGKYMEHELVPLVAYEATRILPILKRYQRDRFDLNGALMQNGFSRL